MGKTIKIFLITCLVSLSGVNIIAQENNKVVDVDELVQKDDESALISEIELLDTTDIEITFNINNRNIDAIVMNILGKDDKLVSYSAIIDLEMSKATVKAISESVSYKKENILRAELIAYNKSKELEKIDITNIVKTNDDVKNTEVFDNQVVNEPQIIADDTIPTIQNIDVVKINYGSYKISAKVNDDSGISRVAFPTWTSNNWQDDIVWKNGVVVGDTVTFIVDMKDHNYEIGDYITHIYVYDDSGNTGVGVVPTQTITTEKPLISNVTVESINSGSYKIMADVSDNYGIALVRFATWSEKGGKDDLVWDFATIVEGKVTYIVDIKDHKYDLGNYLTHIYADNYNGVSTAVAVETQTINDTNPKLENINVEKLNAGSYKVSGRINSYYGVDKVKFPTWTAENGQDDIVWKDGVISRDTFSCIVDIKDHNFEKGTYLTHLYVYDRLGNANVYGVQSVELENKENPTISNLRVSVPTDGKYLIQVDVTDDYNVKTVKFPTWSAANGQSDITWHGGKKEGNTYSYEVNIRDHNKEIGQYMTHIYAYDDEGKVSVMAVPLQTVIRENAEIKNVTITNRRPDGFTVNAEIANNYNIASVKFPTWTIHNGQDDIIWATGRLNGNIYSYDVKIGDHNNETGPYITHVYATELNGEVTAAASELVTVVNNAPVISDIKIINVDSTGYTISCVAQDDLGVRSVEIPTWTEANGQDDLVWGMTVYKGNGVYEYRVNASDHNYESGNYVSIIYAYDNAGKATGEAIAPVRVDTALSPGWVYANGRKYLFNNQGKVVEGAKNLVIDVSEHQGNINWEQVKSSGVDAVILRCGYGWQDDLSQIDDTFNRNANELERLGIPYGVYLFSYANNAYDAGKEAEYALRIVNGRRFDLPIYYDLESDKAIGDVSPATYTAMAHAFCQTIERGGYPAGIYANLNYWNNKLSDPSLDRYTKWVAQYNTNDGLAGHCDYTKAYGAWQYTSVGKVPGINGNVDMNAWYK